MAENVTELLNNATAMVENVTLSTVTSQSLTVNETESTLSWFSSSESSYTLSTNSNDTLPILDDSSITFDSISFGYGILVT